MRDRFMAHGTRSPFSWASRLRVYGKKVRDTSTCLGYIGWTDDGQCVSYKDVPELSMEKLRGFVQDQVRLAQRELEGLLLLHPDERRENLGIEFRMHRLVDNAAEHRHGWSFLQDRRNLEGQLPDRRRWLLERVLQNDWLREEFIRVGDAKDIVWDVRAVLAYKARFDAFLQRLLVLVHLTSGQPARGTEVLSLRYRNTIRGHHRNIFIENGMVSTVTHYHKGYSISGSTKIIHRYLPSQVGELVVYYLWLVLPFWQKLDLLALRNRSPPSPFLWPKKEGSWDSRILGAALKREFQALLGMPVTIPIYRHIAIAISRKHLPCGGFRRDYEAEDTRFDRQSAHSRWTAGSIYARGLEEAAGHVAERKAEYRKINREWHEFLGFLPASLPALKRPLSDITSQANRLAKKARCDLAEKPEMTDSIDVWDF